MTRGAGFVAAVAATLTMAGGAADQTTADSTGVAESISGYVLTWADEFNGSGQADTSNWGYETGMPRNNELQYYRSGADNAAQQDGRLVITLKKEQYGKGKNTAEYTSASLITKGKRSFQYGKYVFRARIPTKKGYWPVMWLMGSNIDSVDWAGCGEIDVQECYWKDNVPNLLCNFCWAGNGNQSDYPTSWNIKNYNVNSLDAGGADAWSSKYHTWAMDWDENSIKIYLDGTPENGYTDGFLLNSQDLSATINGTGGKGGSAGQNPFRLPQYILLNFPFGGDAGGQCGIDDSGLPAQMEVDYIRVYRKVGTQDGLVGANVPDPEPDSAYAPTKFGPAVYDGYELSWSDEFNGTGAPDASNWDYELGYVRNNEAQNYTRDNAVMKDGALVITGKKEQDGTYTSSSIVTKGQRHFLYGRYEFRARIPTSGGAWPVMWMMGTNYTWPNGGEIDILEYYCGTVLCNWCWGGNDPNNMYSQSWNAKRTPLTDFTNVDPDWVNKFHVWRMDWTEERCDVYVDGVWINGQDLSQTLNPNDYGEGTAGISPFRKPQYILLDIAMGGNSGGTIDDSALPMVMEVDYVRCYKRTGTNEGMFVPAPIDITPGTGADYEPDGSAPAKVDGYRLCWNDEFNEGNYPAAANWNVTEGSTVAVGNGVLAMTAQKQGDGSLTWGEVNTKNLHSFTNGIIDIRARIPVTKGLFTSMFTKTVEENENFYAYMEFLDARWISGAPLVAGWWQWNPDGDNGQWYDRQIANLVEKDPKWAAKFHVWRYKVDSENVSISIDGAQIFTYPLAWMYHNGLCTVGSDRFPHYLTMALFSNTDAATLDETRIPAKLEVDYVRCYEPGEETVDPGDDPGPGDDPDDPAPTPTGRLTTTTAGFSVTKALMGRNASSTGWDYQQSDVVDLASALAATPLAQWTATRKVLAGYTTEAHGDFNYDLAGNLWGGIPPVNGLEAYVNGDRWEHSRWVMVRSSATLVVPEAGAWTICLGTVQSADFAVTITGADKTFTMSTEDYADGRAVKTFNFPSAGEYALSVDWYTNDGDNLFLELSSAPGEVAPANFSTNTFSLIGEAVRNPVADGVQANYRYYRFKVENIRNAGSQMMQFSELELWNVGQNVTAWRAGYSSDTTTKPVNGASGDNISPGNEQPGNVLDGSLDSKWLDFRASPTQSQAVRDAVWIVVDFGKAQQVTGYRWFTAGDEHGRDPTAWRFQGSNDASAWYDLDVVSEYAPTADRKTLAYAAGLKTAVPYVPAEPEPEDPDPVDPAYVPSTGEPTVYAGYSMAWNDEFNEDGAPNSADWRVEEGSTLVCTGGALVLTAKSTAVANGENWAALDTRGKRQFKMGRYEIRAKLPFSNGVHASVWFNGDMGEESEWRCYNFIDAEYSWVDAGYYANSIAQWWEWDSTAKDGWSALDIARVSEGRDDWANKYHVWVLDWDEEKIRVTLDGVLQWRHDITAWKTGENAPPFSDPDNLYKIMIGLDRRDVYGSYESLPQTFEIDYIRYYTPVPLGEWPAVDGVETKTPAEFLAAVRDGSMVKIPSSFAWDGAELKKDGSAWASLPDIYSVNNGEIYFNLGKVIPVIGADAQATVDGIAVVDGAVKINVTNAKAGLYYGYRFATALGSLDTAPVTWRGESAAQDGDLLIPAGDAGTAGFYRVIVGDRAPQN